MGVPGEKLLPDEKDADTQDFVMINSRVFFIRDIPFAARAGFYTDPEHKIRYTGGAHDFTEAFDKALYQPGKDQYHGTAGLGIVPMPGFQIDFAGNYSKEVREFSISTVFRF